MGDVAPLRVDPLVVVNRPSDTNREFEDPLFPSEWWTILGHGCLSFGIGTSALGLRCSSFPLGKPGGQEIAQQGLKRRVGRDKLIVGIRVVALVTDVAHELAQSGLVFLGDE